jgi:hypothetical protein
MVPGNRQARVLIEATPKVWKPIGAGVGAVAVVFKTFHHVLIRNQTSCYQTLFLHIGTGIYTPSQI